MPCGVCLETFWQTAQTLGLKDLTFLCSSWGGKNFLRASLSDLLPRIN